MSSEYIWNLFIRSINESISSKTFLELKSKTKEMILDILNDNSWLPNHVSIEGQKSEYLDFLFDNFQKIKESLKSSDEIELKDTLLNILKTSSKTFLITVSEFDLYDYVMKNDEFKVIWKKKIFDDMNVAENIWYSFLLAEYLGISDVELLEIWIMTIKRQLITEFYEKHHYMQIINPISLINEIIVRLKIEKVEFMKLVIK